MSLFLVVDTSICGLAMGLVEGPAIDQASKVLPGTLLWSFVQVEATGAAKMLSACLETGLAAIKRKIEDVSGVLVSQGPGSFTGIRVGIAFASGLQAGAHRLDLQLPQKSGGRALAGVSSIKLFAESASAKRQKPVVVVLPGTKTAGYLVLAGPELPSAIIPINFEHLPEAPVLPAGFAGADQFICGLWPEYFAKFPSEKVVESIEIAAVAEQAMYGMAEHCGRIDWEKAAGGEPSPIYLRRSTVEERFERGGNKIG